MPDLGKLCTKLEKEKISLQVGVRACVCCCCAAVAVTCIGTQLSQPPCIGTHAWARVCWARIHADCAPDGAGLG